MTAPDDIALVDSVIARARKAQMAFEANGSQERYDQARPGGWMGHHGTHAQSRISRTGGTDHRPGQCRR